MGEGRNLCTSVLQEKSYHQSLTVSAGVPVCLLTILLKRRWGALDNVIKGDESLDLINNALLQSSSARSRAGKATYFAREICICFVPFTSVI